MENFELYKRKYGSYSADQLIEMIAGLHTRIEQLSSALYGAKADRRKRVPYENPNQPSLFNDAEHLVDEYLEKSKDNEEKDGDKKKGGEPKPKKKRGKRTELNPDLPRVTEVVDLPDHEKICAVTGNPLVQIGEKCKETLEIIPEQVYVVRTIMPIYKDSCCSDDVESNKIISAKPDPVIIPKSYASPSCLAYIATRKYRLTSLSN